MVSNSTQQPQKKDLGRLDVLIPVVQTINEPRSEKTGHRGFRPGPTQIELYCHRRWIEASNFGF